MTSKSRLGGTNTTWGARRVKDGHPAPFPLSYVEVGNEDQFDREAGSDEARFTQFFDAIRAKYPQLKIIATTRTTARTPDVIDEHFYPRSEEQMASMTHVYDARPRDTVPKVFVGEWATRVGDPTPTMRAALGDAAWMTGMERNSDLTIMSAYAPLFVNVNEGAIQWRPDLIGDNAMGSYGSPAYYAQQMFSAHHGDVVLPLDATGIPMQTWTPPARGSRAGAPAAPGAPPAAAPPPQPPQQVPLVFINATKDSASGTIYLHVVNRAATAQPVHVTRSGVSSMDAKGQAITMSASSPTDTNSIIEPKKIVPVTTTVDGLSANFTRAFPPYSITVLTLKGR